MTIAESDKNTLIKYRLGQSKETASDAMLLIDNLKYRSAVNRIYYSMFYSLLAIALKIGFQSSKHAQLIGWFNKTFIKEAILEKRFGKIINQAFIRRTQGDYDSFVEFNPEAVKSLFDDMEVFNAAIEEWININ